MMTANQRATAFFPAAAATKAQPALVHAEAGNAEAAWCAVSGVSSTLNQVQRDELINSVTQLLAKASGKLA